jgi:hypothetical protein
MRYVIAEERDEFVQRCLDAKCGWVNGVFEEPRRFCVRCHGPLGAFPAYGTEKQRGQRVRWAERFMREYAGG